MTADQNITRPPAGRGPVTVALATMLQSADEPERQRIRELREAIREQLAEQDMLLAKLENGRRTCQAS